MANMFVYVESTDTEYEITLSSHGHAGERLMERIDDYNYSAEFIVCRIRELLQNNDISDVLTNCVKFGENIVIEDYMLGFDIVLVHELDLYSVKTIYDKVGNSKKFNGQKVMSLLVDGNFETYTFDFSKKNKMGVAWA